MEASVNGSLFFTLQIGQRLIARCAGCHKKSDYKSECDKWHRPTRVFEPTSPAWDAEDPTRVSNFSGSQKGSLRRICPAIPS